MTKFKNSFCVKVISSIVVFTFLTLDFACAGSFDQAPQQTLAAESAFQSTKDFNESVLSQAPVLKAILSIGNYLLNETEALSTKKRLEGLRSLIEKKSLFPELNVQDKIKFDHVKFHPNNENIVIIPYKINADRTDYVQIALVDHISQEDMAGVKWTISKDSKYAVTILPKGYDPNQPPVPSKKLKTAASVISEKPIAEIELEEPATTSEPNKAPRVKKVVIKAITLSLLFLFVIPFFIWSCAARTVSTISTPTTNTTSESRLAPKADVLRQEFDVAQDNKAFTEQLPKKLSTEGLTRVKDLGIEWIFIKPDGRTSKSDMESWNLSDADIKNLYGKLVYRSSDLKIYRIYIGGKENCVGSIGVMFGKVALTISYKNTQGKEMWFSFGGKGYVSMSENKKSLERRYGKYVRNIKENNETGQFTGTLRSSFGKSFSIAPDEKGIEVLFDYRYGSISGMIQTSDEFRVNAVTDGQLKIHEDVGFFESRGGLTISSEFTVLEDYDTGLKNVKYWGKAGKEWYVISARKGGTIAKNEFSEFRVVTDKLLEALLEKGCIKLISGIEDTYSVLKGDFEGRLGFLDEEQNEQIKIILQQRLKDARSGNIILEKGSQAKLVYDEFQLTTSDILINTGQSDIKIKYIRGKNKLKPGKAGIIFGGELCTFENEILNGELCKAATQNKTGRLTELINSLKALSIKNERVNETFDKMLPGYSPSKRRPTFLEAGKNFAEISRDKESVKLLSSEKNLSREIDLIKLETAITYVSFARSFNSITYKLTQKTTAANMVYLLNMLTGKTHTDIFSAIREIIADNGFSGLHAIAKVKNLLQNANTGLEQDILLAMLGEITLDKYSEELSEFTRKVQKIMGTSISRLEVIVRIIEFDFTAVLSPGKTHLTFFSMEENALNTDALKERVNVYHVIYGYPTGKNSTNNNGGMITPDIRKPDSTHNTVSDAVNRAQEPMNKTYALFESVTRDPNNPRTVLANAGNDIADFLRENKQCELPPIDRNAATAGVIQSLEQALTALDASDLTLPEEIETAKNKIKANLGDIGITGMLVGIGILAKAAKRKKQNLVIGIDPSWIPGYESGTLQHNAMNPLINELNSIEGILAKRGHNNVKVFINNDRGTLNTWTTDMKTALNSPGDFSSLITIGDMITSNHIENTMLQGISHDKRPLLAEIDPTNLMAFYKAHGENENWQLDIDLLKFISITVDIANDKTAPNLSDLKIFFNRELNKILYYPNAIRIDYTKNKAKNNLNKTTLRSL